MIIGSFPAAAAAVWADSVPASRKFYILQYRSHSTWVSWTGGVVDISVDGLFTFNPIFP